MKRWVLCLVLATVLAGVDPASHARDAGHGGSRGGSTQSSPAQAAPPGPPGQSFSAHGMSGRAPPGSRPAIPGGRHRDFHGHHQHFRGNNVLILSLPLIWVPPRAEPPPLYGPPQEYAEQPIYDGIGRHPNIVYYCPDYGFYPYIQDCPNEWMQVIPDNSLSGW